MRNHKRPGQAGLTDLADLKDMNGLVDENPGGNAYEVFH